LLPVTYNVSPSAAFIMFAGIFYGGMYGGSTTSILLNTPGESSFAQPGEVHDIEERLATCGVEFEFTQPVGVDAAEELLKAMERDDAELLVIGVRYRSPVGKLLLGSVSQQVLLECPKPVLAVKPEQ
jgi:Universal stress protein family/Tripartite tricarboxylate transporter TctA family